MFGFGSFVLIIFSLFWKSGQETLAWLYERLDGGSLPLCSMVAPFGRSSGEMGQRRQRGEWKLIGAHRNYFNRGKEVAFGSSSFIWKNFFGLKARISFRFFFNAAERKCNNLNVKRGCLCIFDTWGEAPHLHLVRQVSEDHYRHFLLLCSSLKDEKVGWNRLLNQTRGAADALLSLLHFSNFCSGGWKRQQVDARWVLSSIWQRAASQLVSVWDIYEGSRPKGRDTIWVAGTSFTVYWAETLQYYSTLMDVCDSIECSVAWFHYYLSPSVLCCGFCRWSVVGSQLSCFLSINDFSVVGWITF